MLWKEECKQLSRTPIRTAAICLALAVAIGLLSITAGLHLAAQRTQETVEAKYTTIATIPTRPAMYLDPLDFDPPSVKNDSLLLALKDGSLELQNICSIDEHSWLTAYSTGILPLCSTHHSAADYSYEMDIPLNTAFFAVTCDRAEVISTKVSTVTNIETGEKISVTYTDYAYQFTVNEVLALHPDIEVPITLSMSCKISSNLGEDVLSMEKGKTYLIWGQYEAIGQGKGVLHSIVNHTMRYDCWSSDRVAYIEYGDGLRLPMIAEYDGSPTSYLSEHKEYAWDALQRLLEVSIHTIYIRSADHPNALRAFVDSTAILTDGAFFTNEQLSQGSKVALISDVLAHQNDLSVGDTMTLSFYRNDWANNLKNTSSNIYDTTALFPYLHFGQYEADFHLSDSAECGCSDAVKHATDENGTYTVVGIYSTEGWRDEYQSLHPNTVIVPQSALTNTYSLNATELNRTFVIPNGKIEEFEAELDAVGYGEKMYYYDQGYSSVIPGVNAISKSAAFIFWFSLTLWTLVILAVFFIMIFFQLPMGKIKYRLGAGKRAIWGQMSLSSLIVILLSAILGSFGSIALYDYAIQWMMNSDFTSFDTVFGISSATAATLEQLIPMLAQPSGLLLGLCLGQAGILLLVAIIFSAISALRKNSFQK